MTQYQPSLNTHKHHYQNLSLILYIIILSVHEPGLRAKAKWKIISPTARATTTKNCHGATIGQINTKQATKRPQISKSNHLSARVWDAHAIFYSKGLQTARASCLPPPLFFSFFSSSPPLTIPPLTELAVDPRCLQRQAAACRLSYRGCKAAAAAPRSAAARRISSSLASRGKTSSFSFLCKIQPNKHGALRTRSFFPPFYKNRYI